MRRITEWWLGMERVKEVLRLWELGANKTEIAQAVGTTRFTVRDSPGLPVANGQKTTLSRRPARTERAKLRTAEVLAHLEGVLAVRVDVLVTAR